MLERLTRATRMWPMWRMWRAMSMVVVQSPLAAQATTAFRGGPAHAGVYAGGGSTIVGVQWVFHTDGDVISSAAVDRGVVYVGSGDGHLYALDLRTGTRRWSYDAGSAVSASPAVVRDVVIAGTYDGRFVGVDAHTGAKRWTVSTGATLPWPWGHESGDRYTSSPSVDGGTVVFGAGDGRVYAVDASTGDVKWKARTGGRIRGSPAISAGSVFVGSFDGRIYAFDLASGRERWHYDTEGASLASGDYGFDRRSIQSSPSVANGVVYVGSRDGFVYAVGANDGKLRWRFDHKISWINSSPAVADGMVYDGSSDAHFVQALDAATGRELWRTAVNTTVWSSPALTATHLFVGDGAGRVLELDRSTGQRVSAFFTGSGVFASPVVVGDLVVVGSTDGNVYALRTANAGAVERAVFLDSAYVRADAAGRSVELATYLSHRGYAVLDPTAAARFLEARLADRKPSVMVFATDHVPTTLSGDAPRTSLLRRYLDAGGKVVWIGVPPLLWSLDSVGKFPDLSQYRWDAPGELLGVPHGAAIFDPRGVHATTDGLRWGQPRVWRSAWGVAPGGVTQVLGLDEWGLAAAWVKSFGGPPGTGFVRSNGDDLLAIFLAAEYRPLP